MAKIVIFLIFSIYLFAIDRVVALSPAINEIIFALNEGDKIVGNSEFCDYPIKSKAIFKVGGYMSPSLEKIVSLKPDIVIMEDSFLETKLKALNIQTKVVKIDNMNSIKNSILEIGELLDKKDKANYLIKDIDLALNSLKNIIENRKILVVIGEYFSLSKDIFVAGNNLYFNDLIAISGNINGSKTNILNLEKIISINPDIIIILAPYNKDKSKLITPWKFIPINATKNSNIFVVDKDYAGVPSDRVIHFINDFRGFLVEVKNR